MSESKQSLNRPRGPDWVSAYAVQYRAAAEQNKVDIECAIIKRKRQASKPDFATGNDKRPPSEFAAKALERAAVRQALVDLRMRDGFRWPGGAVGGNPLYFRGAFTYRGLVSDEHPVLQRFVASTPKAKHLMSGWDKATVSDTDSKILALDCPYVESLKCMRSVLRAELDGIFASWQAIEDAVIESGCPLPNLIVGFELPDGRVAGPHLLWLIDDAVPFTKNGDKRHQALFTAVLKSLTAQLLPIGADPGGLSNPCRHKNPLSPMWNHKISAEVVYTLKQLKGLLPLSKAAAKLKEADPETRARRATPIPQEHPNPGIAAASNRLFGALAPLAYQRVIWYRDQGHGTEADLIQELAAEGLRLMPYRDHAAERVIGATAQSIAKWAWEHYQARAAKPKLAPAEVKAAQQAGAAKTSMARKRKSVVRVALALAKLGPDASDQAVSSASGFSVSTVRRNWAGAMAMFENGETRWLTQPLSTIVIRSPYDKKGTAFGLDDSASPGVSLEAVPEIKTKGVNILPITNSTAPRITTETDSATADNGSSVLALPGVPAWMRAAAGQKWAKPKKSVKPISGPAAKLR